MSLLNNLRQLAGFSFAGLMMLSPSNAFAADSSDSLSSNTAEYNTVLAQRSYTTEAYRNMGDRLASEGFEIYNLDNVPNWDGSLSSGESETLSIYVTPGEYVLLTGGDNDTRDIDLVVHGIGSDLAANNRTGLVQFVVTRAGQISYDISMYSCRTSSCAASIVLLTVD